MRWLTLLSSCVPCQVKLRILGFNFNSNGDMQVFLRCPKCGFKMEQLYGKNDLAELAKKYEDELVKKALNPTEEELLADDFFLHEMHITPINHKRLGRGDEDV